MKVKILGDWTLIVKGEHKTQQSEPFDLDDQTAERYARRMMVEIIPTEEKKDAKAKSS